MSQALGLSTVTENQEKEQQGLKEVEVNLLYVFNIVSVSQIRTTL